MLNKAEIEEYFTREKEPLTCFARRVLAERGLRRGVDPEDLVQETFLKIIKDAPNSSLTAAKLPLYTPTIMKGIAVDMTRKATSLKRDGGNPKESFGTLDSDQLSDHGLAASRSAHEVETREAFDKVISTVPRRARRVLEMRLEGYTDREIAANQGCSLATVERDVRMGKAFTKKYFGKQASDVPGR